MTASPMTPGWHAERTPDAPAIVMGSTGEIVTYAELELATYKCPRSVDFVGELPREPNGKLYKRLLRERYWAGHDSLVI